MEQVYLLMNYSNFMSFVNYNDNPISTYAAKLPLRTLPLHLYRRRTAEDAAVQRQRLPQSIRIHAPRDRLYGGVGNQCRKHCEFPNQCIYSKCFETPVPDDSPLLQGQPFAPHPFIIQPPRTRRLDYVPGETLACNLILIGEAINILPWMVFTFNEIGKRRMGIQGKRGRCRLDKVESLAVSESEKPETIYTTETQMLTGEGCILRVDDVIAHSDRDASTEWK